MSQKVIVAPSLLEFKGSIVKKKLEKVSMPVVLAIPGVKNFGQH